MKLKISLTLALTATIFIVSAQTSKIIIQENIRLPKDTIVANQLIKSLNSFLAEKEKTNKENTFVLKEDLPETSAWLDEIKGIEKSQKFKDDYFYKGYLTNVVPINKTDYLVQFSYIGVNENKPILMASFELLAKKKDSRFYFASTLKKNTKSWKSKTFGNISFHFKNTLNEKVAKNYEKQVSYYDKKLNAPNSKIEWYGCDDLQEVLKTVGVPYKLDYNGANADTFSGNENNILVRVVGQNNASFNSFDPHDLWHDRLHNVISTSIINKPVDEGCAYLYGGSWEISWSEILKTFKEKVSSNSKTNWLATYEDFYDFGESKEKHLLVPYVINALIIEKLEKEKGFSAVIELLSCGKYQKGNENYYKTLEKLTGITKSNYNEKVWELINNAK
jgi:hypothetical protein